MGHYVHFADSAGLAPVTVLMQSVSAPVEGVSGSGSGSAPGKFLKIIFKVSD